MENNILSEKKSLNKTNFQINSYLLLFILAILGFIITVLIMVSDFNSDFIIMTSLYDSMFVDHLPMAGWNFCATTEFFPDMLLFFPIKWAIPDLIYSNMAFAFIMLLIYSYFTFKLFETLKMTWIKTHEYWALSLFYLAVVLSCPISNTAQRLWPTSHAGIVVAGLAIVLITCSLITKQRYTVSIFILQLILSAALITSDHLIVSQFLVPIVTAIGIFAILGLIQWRYAIITLISYALGYIIAELILWYLRVHLHFSLPQFNFKLFELRSFLQFVHDMQHSEIMIEFVCTILCFVISVAILISNFKFIKRLKTDRNDAVYIGIYMSILFLSQLFWTVTAPIISGNWNDEGSFRYLSSLWFLSPIMSIWFISFYLYNKNNGVLEKRIKNIIILILLTIFVYNNYSFIRNSDSHILLKPYPGKVECVDSIAREFSVKYAYSGYWPAKYLTVLSIYGLRVNQWDNNLNEYHWLNNKGWYTNAPMPNGKEPVMILTGEMNNNLILKNFGEPKAIRQCEGFGQIYVYPKRIQ